MTSTKELITGLEQKIAEDREIARISRIRSSQDAAYQFAAEKLNVPEGAIERIEGTEFIEIAGFRFQYIVGFGVARHSYTPAIRLVQSGLRNWFSPILFDSADLVKLLRERSKLVQEQVTP
jgi:hypothetical protein